MPASAHDKENACGTRQVHRDRGAREIAPTYARVTDATRVETPARKEAWRQVHRLHLAVDDVSRAHGIVRKVERSAVRAKALTRSPLLRSFLEDATG